MMPNWLPVKLMASPHSRIAIEQRHRDALAGRNGAVELAPVRVRRDPLGHGQQFVDFAIADTTTTTSLPAAVSP
jgi:hypothetical protein